MLGCAPERRRRLLNGPAPRWGSRGLSPNPRSPCPQGSVSAQSCAPFCGCAVTPNTRNVAGTFHSSVRLPPNSHVASSCEGLGGGGGVRG